MSSTVPSPDGTAGLIIFRFCFIEHLSSCAVCDRLMPGAVPPGAPRGLGVSPRRAPLGCTAGSPSWSRVTRSVIACDAGGALEYARHGRSLGGESPLEEEVVLTPSRRQLRRREAGWEGSPRRNSAPRNTNRVEGGAIWVSLLKKVKPVTINRVVSQTRRAQGESDRSYPGRSAQGVGCAVVSPRRRLAS